ncbi:DUF3422 family protein [Mesorhizobium atlanticum]
MKSRCRALTPGRASCSAAWRRPCAPAARLRSSQANLSRKLTRATTLLRTWVDVDVEKQNRDLLASMNNRARLQLRLQQTVEGLSVAAVSYYVVGLIGYVAKGASIFGHAFAPEVVTAASCSGRHPAGLVGRAPGAQDAFRSRRSIRASNISKRRAPAADCRCGSSALRSPPDATKATFCNKTVKLVKDFDQSSEMTDVRPSHAQARC